MYVHLKLTQHSKLTVFQCFFLMAKKNQKQPKKTKLNQNSDLQPTEACPEN